MIVHILFWIAVVLIVLGIIRGLYFFYKDMFADGSYGIISFATGMFIIAGLFIWYAVTQQTLGR